MTVSYFLRTLVGFCVRVCTFGVRRYSLAGRGRGGGFNANQNEKSNDIIPLKMRVAILRRRGPVQAHHWQVAVTWISRFFCKILLNDLTLASIIPISYL